MASPPASPSSPARPLVGIPCCVKELGPHPFHVVGDKYIRAVSDGAGAVPMLLPALGDWYEWSALLDRLDGLLITGSPSNVEPHRYDGPASAPGTDHDPARDATTLPLIAAALARGMPVLAICRGLQELNVALGGTLHQAVQDIPGRQDHRADPDQPVEVQYGLAHPVDLAPDGQLAAITGQTRFLVNTVHGQGIDRLAEGLTVEARAPDGQIEAVRVGHASGFALAVQWHPEWRFWEREDSARLFAAFGDAVRTYARQRGTARHAAA